MPELLVDDSPPSVSSAAAALVPEALSSSAYTSEHENAKMIANNTHMYDIRRQQRANFVEAIAGDYRMVMTVGEMRGTDFVLPLPLQQTCGRCEALRGEWRGNKERESERK